ncbi:MAG: hypothetical protein E6I75_00600 [Chloroflexi bacterium]|nr:MAG: hypothetical protein E6I75_00600 [Chloroflexota bacterium]
MTTCARRPPAPSARIRRKSRQPRPPTRRSVARQLPTWRTCRVRWTRSRPRSMPREPRLPPPMLLSTIRPGRARPTSRRRRPRSIRRKRRRAPLRQR